MTKKKISNYIGVLYLLNNCIQGQISKWQFSPHQAWLCMAWILATHHVAVSWHEKMPPSVHELKRSMNNIETFRALTVCFSFTWCVPLREFTVVGHWRYICPLDAFWTLLVVKDKCIRTYDLYYIMKIMSKDMLCPLTVGIACTGMPSLVASG